MTLDPPRIDLTQDSLIFDLTGEDDDEELVVTGVRPVRGRVLRVLRTAEEEEGDGQTC